MSEYIATIENEPISIQLRGNDQTTVPSGEVWKVSVTLGKQDTDSDWLADFRVNGVTACSFAGTDRMDYQSNGSTSFETVLKENDTLRMEDDAISNNDIGCHISGFKVGIPQ
jgi:hypothetical protein